MSGEAVRAWPFRGVLVTGGAGYLGSALIRRLAPKLPPEARVRILSRRAVTAGGEPIHADVERVVGDLRDPGIWRGLLEGIDLIVHLAAQTSAYAAEADPLESHEINVAATLRLLEAARTTGRRPVVLFAGTATQAGLAPRLPVDESAPDEPVTLYDVHKTMGENYLRYHVRRGHVRGASLRLANVYGPGPASGSADRGMLNGMIRRALHGETLTVYGAGTRIRDYVYVDDVADAFEAAARGIDRVDGGYFVIGTGRGTSIRDALALVAERAFARTGRRSEIASVEPPRALSPIEDRDFVADSSRFRRETGWNPAVSLADGIDRTIDALLAEGGTGA